MQLGPQSQFHLRKHRLWRGNQRFRRIHQWRVVFDARGESNSGEGKSLALLLSEHERGGHRPIHPEDGAHGILRQARRIETNRQFGSFLGNSTTIRPRPVAFGRFSLVQATPSESALQFGSSPTRSAVKRLPPRAPLRRQ